MNNKQLAEKRQKIELGVDKLIPYDPLEQDRPPKVVTAEILRFLSDNGVMIADKNEPLPENPYSLDCDKLPPEFQEEDDRVTAEDVYLMHYNGIEKGKRLMLKAGYLPCYSLKEKNNDRRTS